MNSANFIVVTLWCGDHTKHSVIRREDIREMCDVPKDQTSAPFDLVQVTKDDGTRVQFVGTLDSFILLLGAANGSNNIPQLTAEQLREAKANDERFRAEQETKQKADFDQAVRDAVAAQKPTPELADTLPGWQGV
jgi:hypothetical protein